eukprot:2620983-Prymnesium_polylepis.1
MECAARQPPRRQPMSAKQACTNTHPPCTRKESFGKGMRVATISEPIRLRRAGGGAVHAHTTFGAPRSRGTAGCMLSRVPRARLLMTAGRCLEVA